MVAGLVVAAVASLLVVNHQRAAQAEKQREIEMFCDLLHTFGTNAYYECTGGSPQDDAPEPGQLDLLTVDGVDECKSENVDHNVQRFGRELTDDETGRIEAYCAAIDF